MEEENVKANEKLQAIVNLIRGAKKLTAAVASAALEGLETQLSAAVEREAQCRAASDRVLLSGDEDGG